jgi:hypothetical protein
MPGIVLAVTNENIILSFFYIYPSFGRRIRSGIRTGCPAIPCSFFIQDDAILFAELFEMVFK